MQIVLTANKDGVYADKIVKAGDSVVTIGTGQKREGTMGEPDSGTTEATVSLKGSADATVSGEFTRKVGSEDFGTTTLNVTGTAKNGFQALGDTLQSVPVPASIAAGTALKAAAPAGTIDFSMNFKITGSGKVEWAGGEAKGYPSYGVFAYTRSANGNIQTTVLRTVSEGQIEELTQPMKRIP